MLHRHANPTGRFDIVSVGDVATDVFIRLLAAHTETFEDERGRWLAMPFGAKLPFDHAQIIEAGGNAGSAAVAFARLGLRTAFATHVGADAFGRDMVAALAREGVDARFVRSDPQRPSNTHYVLWFGDERTILVHHEDYDYRWPELRPPEEPAWLYFTSVSEHALGYHDEISDWLDEHPAVRLAFQPGTFQIEVGAARLARVYRRAEVLVCNREEAVRIGGGDHEDVADLITGLHALGPEVVVVTDGPRGAFASDGKVRVALPIFPDAAPPRDRTGAGDAFAATFVASRARGHELAESLERAAVNAASVVQAVGPQAGLLEEEILAARLASRPDGFAATEW